MFTHVALRPVPEDVKPAPHVHEYPPLAFVHALTLPPVRVRPHAEAVLHSLMSVHDSLRVPSLLTEKPSPQVQSYAPLELVHALTLPPVSVRPHVEAVPHSSVSSHDAVSPLPVALNPEPQEHEYPPLEFVHALTLPPVSVRPHVAAVLHSLTSTHDSLSVPELVSVKPSPHVQL
jgi:peptidase E